MTDVTSALSAALHDVGYWLHWEHKLPESMQLQFGGVQLLLDAAAPGEAPAGQIALRFLQVTSLSFLWHQSAPEDLLPDWPERLRHDAFGPVDITRGALTLGSADEVLQLLRQARRIMSATGVDPRFNGLAESGVRLAFFAGPVGVVLGAAELQVFTPQGPLALDEIPRRRAAWLEYRRRYFAAKAAGEPLPSDYACEAAGPEVEVAVEVAQASAPEAKLEVEQDAAPEVKQDAAPASDGNSVG